MKQTVRVLLFATLVCGVSAFASETLREVAFDDAAFTSSAPKMDGKLDDPCWKNAPVHTRYYEYFKPNPKPGELRTECRFLYDSRGLYLGITNYEAQPEKVRRIITDRDNPQLWTDDCAEIYIDCRGNAIGFTKFVVSARGVQGDMRRIDGAVTLNEWNGNGWNSAVSVDSDRWTIEAFFPWEDLGAPARPGDVWRFCHVRYAWSTGKFQGVTSSPGGNYASTGNFGFLSFLAPGEKSSPDRPRGILAERVAPPWCMELDGVLLYDEGKGIRTEPLSAMIGEKQRQVDSLLKATEGASGALASERARLAADHQKTGKADGFSLSRYQELEALASNLEKLQWKLELERNFN